MTTNCKFTLPLFCAWLALLPAAAGAADTVHHTLMLQLQPRSAALKVSDTITLPEALRNRENLRFRLHGDLQIDGGDLRVTRLDAAADTAPGAVPIAEYEVRLPAGAGSFTLNYHGKIQHQIARTQQEAERSFSESPGLIDEQGVFLAASSYWFPQFADSLLAFKLTVALPGGWDAVSQGVRVQHTVKTGHTLVVWQETAPQDDLYVVAAKFREYSQPAGDVTAMVFLRQRDDALAANYLDATAQYLAMYEKLLGPYPYRKFALVENFWETGYGMPSFTLLGSKVIRFPFIIVSSYPHEILHNWWGNGVYVDYAKGNWSEGLTAYLADHLLKEQRGQGVEHRRDTLQKYTDFVSAGKDFPLTEFVSRHSSVTEAVGYGKTLMLFHMLRLQMGDQAFSEALARFYQEMKFQHASFDDVARVFAASSGQDYSEFFAQWVQRTGAPQISLHSAASRAVADGYELELELQQTQPEPVYRLSVPVAVTLEATEQAYQTRLEFNAQAQKFKLKLPARPALVRVDPEFDVFRRLHPAEIPAAMSQGFGAGEVVAVLPAKADTAVRDALQALLRQWQDEAQIEFQVKLDSDLSDLPDAQAVWLLGWDNTLLPQLAPVLREQQVEIQTDAVQLAGQSYARAAQQVVLAARHPRHAAHTVLWLAADDTTAIANLGRKLPHYRKYSYLAFAGANADNVAKGQWQLDNTPLVARVQQADGREAVAGRGTLAPRPPLIELPPAFSAQRLRQDVQYLAARERQGRGAGTRGLQQAGDYIAAAFKQAGLRPGGDDGGYFQNWRQDLGAPVGATELRNVIGILPGSDPRFAGQSVVVAAHYDHLGSNWPQARKPDAGKLHPGADDNASGVAVLLEYLRAHGAKAAPRRTVIYIAFSGEEWQRAGSRYYVEHAGDYPMDKVMGIVNLDTVGRLGKNPVTVFGTATASEWIHIFQGASFVTGVPITPVASEWGFSDQRSFYDKGVSGVQLFAGVNHDFHRPTDTADKLDYDGMVKIAGLLKEAVDYLAQRADPLSVSLPTAEAAQSEGSAPPPVRKSGLGTVPDYAWQGGGVRISDVNPGSPAQQAGLQAQDVIIAIDDAKIDNLRDYAQRLRAYTPGAQIRIRIRRGDQELEKTATLGER